MDFLMSGWNYLPLGSYDFDKAIDEWKLLGLNCPVSFRYDPKVHDKRDMLRLLDKCEQKGIKLLVEDERCRYSRLFHKTEEEFRDDVKQAVDDFGFHPAIFGFHIGDEPYGLSEESKKPWEKAVTAIKTCNEFAPHLNHFINLLPYWYNENEENNDSFFEATGARTPEEYSAVVKKFVSDSGLKYIGYDCYTVLCYFEKERYKDNFFINYKLFSDALKGTGVKLVVSLLSTGHMSLKVPNQDEFRYQISSAVACGATGIMWFFLYQGNWDASFRCHPINMWGEKTPTFYALSEEGRTMMQVFAPEFKDFEYVGTTCVNKTYGDYEEWKPNGDFLTVLKTDINPNPLMVGLYENKQGERMYVVMNNDYETPTFLHSEFEFDGKKRVWDVWLSPGQFITLRKPKR